MANICCDDVYFYSQSNPEHLAALWEDLETSIVFCSNEDLAWIGNLFELKNIPTEYLPVSGTLHLPRTQHNGLGNTDRNNRY